MDIANMHDATKTRLFQLVGKAGKGESFIVARAGKPVVRVSAIEAQEPAAVRRLGFIKGQIQSLAILNNWILITKIVLKAWLYFFIGAGMRFLTFSVFFVLSGCAVDKASNVNVFGDGETKAKLLDWYEVPPELIDHTSSAQDEDYYKMVQWDAKCETSMILASNRLAKSGGYEKAEEYYDLASVFSVNKNILKRKLDLPDHIFSSIQENSDLVDRPKGEEEYVLGLGSTAMHMYFDEAKVARAEACMKTVSQVHAISGELKFGR